MQNRHRALTPALNHYIGQRHGSSGDFYFFEESFDRSQSSHSSGAPSGLGYVDERSGGLLCWRDASAGESCRIS